MLTRFAVRRIADGLWRSARDSSAFGPWEGAQLWENHKKAQEEANSFARRKKFLGWDSTVQPSKSLGYVPDPWPSEVVLINVPEPK